MRLVLLVRVIQELLAVERQEQQAEAVERGHERAEQHGPVSEEVPCALGRRAQLR